MEIRRNIDGECIPSSRIREVFLEEGLTNLEPEK